MSTPIPKIVEITERNTCEIAHKQLGRCLMKFFPLNAHTLCTSVGYHRVLMSRFRPIESRNFGMACWKSKLQRHQHVRRQLEPSFFRVVSNPFFLYRYTSWQTLDRPNNQKSIILLPSPYLGGGGYIQLSLAVCFPRPKLAIYSICADNFG